MDAPAPAAPSINRRGPNLALRNGCFVLEAMNGLGTSFYNYYIFFFMERRFGFGKADNLLLTVFYGFTYMFAAAGAGQLAHRLGHFRLLRLGFIGMVGALCLGALAPAVWGYSHLTLWIEFVVLAVWAASASMSWPTLQALLSRESPGELPRVVGIYNLIWAGTSGVAFLTGGTLFEFSNRFTVFLLPAAIHLLELVVLTRLQKRAGDSTAVAVEAAETPPAARSASATEKAKAFVRLAWIANPFAYVAMYGFIPVIPQLAQRLGLTTPQAGVAFSLWFWSRLVAFFWFWHWPGWHYRFRWLLSAFVAMIASFFVILLSRQLWPVVMAEVAFGLAIGLIYYSSLYYSMDVGASESKKGGIHEAAIGFGICAGPAVGFGALTCFPGNANAGTWTIGAALGLGLLAFLAVRIRWWPKKS